jgi:hypothetical protein
MPRLPPPAAPAAPQIGFVTASPEDVGGNGERDRKAGHGEHHMYRSFPAQPTVPAAAAPISFVKIS